MVESDYGGGQGEAQPASADKVCRHVRRADRPTHQPQFADVFSLATPEDRREHYNELIIVLSLL